MTKLTAKADINWNESGLPYGAGSLQMRGKVYWIIYRDLQGKQIQENTQTDDRDAALMVLAKAALKMAQARVDLLKGIIREYQGHKKGRAVRAGSRASAASRPRPVDSTRGRNPKGARN